MRYAWPKYDIEQAKSQEILTALIEASFEEYRPRNLQARICSYLLEHIVFSRSADIEVGSDEFKDCLRETIEPLTELITSGDLE